MSQEVDNGFSRLVEIMARLRGPAGCPWDREQTPQTLKPYLIEEAYEVLEALEANNPQALREELGDLLLQVVFHAEIASQAGTFTIHDVVQGLIDKLIRRHPHVFGNLKVKDASEVVQNWSKIKAQEKRGKEERSILAGVPKSAPALIQAQRLGEKASRVGFDWSVAKEVLDKVREETDELEQILTCGRRCAENLLRQEEELGDLLFALTSLARHLELDAEMALRKAIKRFTERFHYIEEQVAAAGQDIHQVSLADLEALWQEAKKVRG
jgi:tetrapyrrole methylase family protein/MazG family protein